MNAYYLALPEPERERGVAAFAQIGFEVATTMSFSAKSVSPFDTQ
jgi:hypothetical protein